MSSWGSYLFMYEIELYFIPLYFGLQVLGEDAWRKRQEKMKQDGAFFHRTSCPCFFFVFKAFFKSQKHQWKKISASQDWQVEVRPAEPWEKERKWRGFMRTSVNKWLGKVGPKSRPGHNFWSFLVSTHWPNVCWDEMWLAKVKSGHSGEVTKLSWRGEGSGYNTHVKNQEISTHLTWWGYCHCYFLSTMSTYKTGCFLERVFLRRLAWAEVATNNHVLRYFHRTMSNQSIDC